MQVLQLVGGAGTGKTTELLHLMEKVLERVHDPMLVGFISMTRAARREAANRAGDRFNIPPRVLEQAGWFRTVHSVCYRCLGAGKELLTDSADNRKWLSEATGEALTATGGNLDDDMASGFVGADQSDADRALVIWQLARGRLEPYELVRSRLESLGPGVPCLSYCRQVVERYEQAKRLDGRQDFTDLLSRFAGWYCTMDGMEPCTPEGIPPKDVIAWIIDESQDSSKLLHEVELRLIAQDSVRWVYVAGDPWQSIYGFSGASPEHFLTGFGPAVKRIIMPRSYRCAKPILELGESILKKDCLDWFDRHIEPAPHLGVIERIYSDRLPGAVDPTESWLVLARTNWLAAQLGKQLTKSGIPWQSTRGASTWVAPVRNQAITALLALAAGSPIDVCEWQAILKNITVNDGTTVLLERGTKAKYGSLTKDEAITCGLRTLENLTEWGATLAFVESVRAGRWYVWIHGSIPYAQAIQQWGREAVEKLSIQVGTVHSAKGAEADNVALLTSVPAIVQREVVEQEGAAEEARIRYVGVTRARRRLVIVDERRCSFRWKIEL